MVVAAGEPASRPRAASGASTTRVAITVMAITATNARTGDGPRYGSSVRRLRSTACEPAADHPDREHDLPGEEQPRGCGSAAREDGHQDDGEAHDGADPADEVEGRDRAALEAERRRARPAIAVGVRRGRLGQGSGIVPGAPRLADGGWRTRPDLGARARALGGAVVVDREALRRRRVAMGS